MTKLEGISWTAWKLAAAAVAVSCMAGFLALGADGRLTERTATVTVPPDSDDASAAARCPKGKKVVLGGFELSAATDDLYPTHLKREGKRRWLAGALNFDNDEPGTVTSIAYCAKLKGIRARSETAVLPDQGPGDPPLTVEAKCRRKERLVFGGFDFQATAAPNAYLSDLRRVGKRGWLVGAYNFNGDPTLTAIAYCSKRAPKTSTESETVTVGGNQDANLTVRCGRGERLAFGGYSAEVTSNNAFVILQALARISGRSWEVDARNGNSVFAGDLTAYAYCAEK